MSDGFICGRSRLFVAPTDADDLSFIDGKPEPPWREIRVETTHTIGDEPREDQKMSKEIQLYARRKNGQYVPLDDGAAIVQGPDGGLYDSETGYVRYGHFGEELLGDGEEVEVSNAFVERALDAFFTYGPSVTAWQNDPRSAMIAALRAAAGEALGIDAQKLGAFLAGEGVVTMGEAMLWSQKLGYDSQSSMPDEVDAVKELMVVLNPPRRDDVTEVR